MISGPIQLILFMVLVEGDTPWWNYPGFELWKFLNLGFFALAAWYLHKRLGRPISEALRTRKDEIRRQLAKAREERDKALRQLEQVEARIQGLQSEVTAIRDRAKMEAKTETVRIQQETEAEMLRLRQNARREIEMAGKAALTELRRFAAEQSIRRAEEIIRRNILPEDEARLIRSGTRNVGGPGI